VIYGAGGMAREVAWLIRRINAISQTWDFLGYVVTDLTMLGPRDSTDEIVGDEEWLLARPDLSVALGMGNPMHRYRIGIRLSRSLPDRHFPILIDPSALYDEDSTTFESGVIVTAGCVLNVNTKLLRFCYLNPNCTIGHESIIGEACVLNPSANISGGVDLGASSLVGTGAQILQYIAIGAGATVGAGAVVTRPVPPDTVVVGVPARRRL
jgi:sugar O-acyltransferase (sialic acid O-acetyltransferase NeuD family)